MKKALSLCLVIVMLSAFFCIGTNAFGYNQESDIPLTQLGTSDTYYSFDASSKTLTVSGEGAMPNFTNTSSGSSAQPWFSWRSDGSIEHIVVEEGVTSLGAYAFDFVQALSVSLPSTLTAIGSYALACNNVITEHIIPNGVTKLGLNAFYYCASLERVVIPESVTSVGASCFQQCAKLASVEFSNPDMKVTIGKKAFVGCESLSVITLPRQATLSAYAYGYKRDAAGAVYDNVLMRVYRDSKAYEYAQSNAIDYELISDMELYQGAVISRTFYSETLGESMVFTFTPSVTAVYDFYSSGDIDVDCTVENQSGDVVAQAADNSNMDLNFTVSTTLEEGEQYSFIVDSVQSSGSFTVTFYPHNVKSLQHSLDLSLNAVGRNAYYDIPSLIEGGEINVTYDTGYTKTVTFSQGNAVSLLTMNYTDNQSEIPFTCGRNYGEITLGNASAIVKIDISHSYGKTVIDPTFESPGYTRYECIACGDSFMTDYKKRLGVYLSGRIVLAESPLYESENDYPVSFAELFSGDEKVGECDENGEFEIYVTADTNSITLHTSCSADRIIAVNANEFNEEYFGDIPLVNFDFCRDGYINAKDYAVIKRYFGSYESSNKSLLQFDINKDGKIDDSDFPASEFYSYGKITES